MSKTPSFEEIEHIFSELRQSHPDWEFIVVGSVDMENELPLVTATIADSDTLIRLLQMAVARVETADEEP